MQNKILNNKLTFILIHLVFGFLGTLPFFPSIIGLLSIVFPLYLIYTEGNENEIAFFSTTYIVGAEVFIRMTGGFVFYETGKYAVILFLI